MEPLPNQGFVSRSTQLKGANAQTPAHHSIAASNESLLASHAPTGQFTISLLGQQFHVLIRKVRKRSPVKRLQLPESRRSYSCLISIGLSVLSLTALIAIQIASMVRSPHPIDLPSQSVPHYSNLQ